MWIFLNDAFLSIIAPPGRPDSPDLVVRARFAGDIERAFPEAKVTRTPARDYLYRTTLPRARVAAALAAQVEGIAYGNFKGSVREGWRHDAYLDVWSCMNREQRRRMMG